MDKTAFNAHLVKTRLKRVFYNLKSIDCGRSVPWKSFDLGANEKREKLDFAAG